MLSLRVYLCFMLAQFLVYPGSWHITLVQPANNLT